MVKNLRIDEFDYELPEERIARYPLAQRDSCKLLVRSHNGDISEHTFTELPALLPADSMLIYNNTRVINARLRFHKPGGALIEVFCLEPVAPHDYAVSFAQTESCSWQCFVGNSKRWKQGPLTMELSVNGQQLTFAAERCEKNGNSSIVKFSWNNPAISFSEIIAAVGEIPIPPYLNRNTEASDSTDYQTVYSHIDGSVAAPTAGLHFTDRVLDEISQRGIPRRELTLHVGAGTFQPVKSDEIGDHLMHSEFIAVSRDLIAELAETSRQVIAVGTTSVRTLESLYHAGKLIAANNWDGEVPQWAPYTDQPDEATNELSVSEAMKAILAYLDSRGESTFIASTRIIIAPGYRYRVVKGMVTNFHQPRSTLLLLVSAFTNGDWRPIYDYALAHNFRFLSYGDACLLL
jgi:S-adenosylmethionine:tRNA ribosyltransferase-isomerase